MKPVRMLLLVAAALLAWRIVHGREHQLLQHARRRLGGAPPETPADAPGSTRGRHTSAASAANDEFRDDRDVTVGENVAAVGIRPGGI